MSKPSCKTLPEQIAEQIGNALIAESRPLLSVRQLAKEWQVSPGTIHKALRQLCSQGLLHAIPRKGYVPGHSAQSARPTPDPFRHNPTEEHAAWLLSRFRSGQLDPFQALPLQKELARTSGAALPTIAKALQSLRTRGFLERRGRRWYWATALPPRSHQTLIVIQRCAADGTLLLETDREMAFIKACYAVSIQLQLPLRVLGWHNSGKSGSLLLADGSVQDWNALKTETLGFLVSTWLLPGTRSLLMRLAQSKIPLAVWWEHPRQLLRQYMPRGRSIAYFDLAFGKAPGFQVARDLLAQGAASVGFLSPFHAAEWSRNRWSGMSSLFKVNHITHTSFVDTRFTSLPELEKQGCILSEVVESLLPDTDHLQDFPHVLVCVNDLTAACALQWSRRHQVRTRIVSFDNSDLSYRLRIDSFEFNTEGMVRGMIHSVMAPGRVDSADRDAYSQAGKMVLK